MDTSTATIADKKKKSLEDYEIVEGKQGHLGKGAYATVKLVKDKENPNKLFAMKIVRQIWE